MKHSVILTFLLISIGGFAQKSFTIVATSGEVTLNDNPVPAGQIISDATARLVIGDRNSYVYVVTSEGRHAKLSDGSYKTKTIDDVIEAKARQEGRPPLTSGLVCRLPYQVVYEGMTDRPKPIHRMIGDSLFLRWAKNPRFNNVKDPLGFSITNMFNDPFYEHKSSEQFVLINLKPFFETDNNLVIQMTDAPMLTIKKEEATTTTRIINDLQMIHADPLSKRVLDLVVYESNGMILDVLFHYNKKPLDVSSLPNDLQNYVAALANRLKIQ